MTELLAARGLTVGYGKAAVGWDLDLAVRPGEIVALLGPNGAGKTTTLLTLAGFLPPLAGTVSLRGKSTAKTRPEHLARAGLAFIPDDRALLASLTVRETLRLVNNPVIRPAELFPQLEQLMDRRCGQLSGGEQQMVAIARALSPRPPLVMIDELSLGLAPVVVERLLAVLRQEADNAGTAVLLVEQQVQEALTVADRALVLVHGRVVLSEDARTLRENKHLIESSYLGENALA
ncbi:MAG TPA: ABC transporter ATP-binding protein [Trebonia sp.]|jgi:branched-chain amino acid transport system ATP-binding protein